MKTIMLPLAALVTFGTAGIAAADVDQGTITSMNLGAGKVTLSSGVEYDFDSNKALRGFNVGNEVQVRLVNEGTEIHPVSIAPVD